MGTQTPPQIAPTLPSASVPRWPTRIGVLSVILALLGLIWRSFSFIASLSAHLKRKAEAASQGNTTALEEAGAGLNRFLAYQSPHFLLLLALLVFAVLLLRRKALAGRLLLVWSLIQIVVGAWYLKGIAATLASLAKLGDPTNSALASHYATAATGIAFALVFMLHALFLLIWFSRAKTRSDLRSLAGGHA